MLNEVAKKWVAALRSGEYSQGHHSLRTVSGHCCLGVLCELAMKDGVIKTYDYDEVFLPDEVVDWAGLTDECANFAGDQALWRLNDGYMNETRSHSFAEIASIIESEPEGLFVKKEA